MMDKIQPRSHFELLQNKFTIFNFPLNISISVGNMNPYLKMIL